MRSRVITFCLTFFVTMMSSCEEKLCGCTVMDIGTVIIVSDQKGQNLLDPDTPGHFVEQDIRIYFLRDGKREEVFHSNLDAPRSFSIETYGSDNELAMKLVPDIETKGTGVTTTIIQWNDSEEDTVACEVRNNDNGVFVTRVWYNNDLAYDPDSGVTGCYPWRTTH